ncbi:UNVERIFIED_CONTAM: hypothetical protein Sradi_2313500 [Sesamum radiatum]|uniref:Uncharacterized protein n=1 Tax=Sesamum radiatum TaxID=300843 RepID=A0AAW2T571_SESRA
MDAEVLRSSGNTEMGGTKTGQDSCDERAEVGGEDGVMQGPGGRWGVGREDGVGR